MGLVPGSRFAHRLGAVRLALAAVLAITVAAAAASPTGAGPAAAIWTVLETKPIDVHGYRMTIRLAKTIPSAGGASLQIELLRARGRGVESDNYAFLKHLRFAAGPGLSPARLTASLGRFGRLALTFAAAQPAGHGTLPPRCRGRLLDSLPGELRGTLVFAPGSRYFGVVRERALVATLSRVEGLRCSQPIRDLPARQPGTVSLGAGTGGGSISFGVAKPRHGNPVESFEVDAAVPSLHVALFDAYISHTLLAPVPRADFTAASDLSAARLLSRNRLISGAVRFRATGAHVGNGRPGIETGMLQARFDSIGTVRILNHRPLSGWLDKF
jgi:hypothetical protein